MLLLSELQWNKNKIIANLLFGKSSTFTIADPLENIYNNTKNNIINNLWVLKYNYNTGTINLHCYNDNGSDNILLRINPDGTLTRFGWCDYEMKDFGLQYDSYNDGNICRIKLKESPN